ncbi:MAG: hypothetical protein IPN17_08035 [Deltaproteobacteria bacterium]|nr:hypothetical protein [Deltaproteobacteria bacterium]
MPRRGLPRGLNGHDVIGYVQPLTRTVGGQWIAQHAAKATPTVLADHVGTAISAAAEGFGVAAAPCFIAAREPRVRSVRAKPIGESECFLVTHQGTSTCPGCASPSTTSRGGCAPTRRSSPTPPRPRGGRGSAAPPR